LIIAKATLLVYPRQGTVDLKDLEYRRHAQFITAPQIEISSSMIRRRVASGKPVRYLVPEVVEQYILDHRLYSRDG
jgi:nicotinate-nucleotide adenylyltransferase